MDKKLTGMTLRSLKRTRDLFLAGASEETAANENSSLLATRLAAKVAHEYSHVANLPVAPERETKRARTQPASSIPSPSPSSSGKRDDVKVEVVEEDVMSEAVGALSKNDRGSARPNSALVLFEEVNKRGTGLDLTVFQRYAKPTWHAPWKLKAVIASHVGHVRCVTVEPGNEWFATGSSDRTIKLFDMASHVLKLTLTGHIATVRGVAASPRHPYLFSCAEDRQIKCWDLESNKVIRHYYGHLNGIYCIAVHPKLDLVVTGGRDSTARVWDMRTKAEIHVLTGHNGLVASLLCQATDPQITTGSSDSTIRTWDIRTGKTISILTNHKKSVRALAQHPTEFTFASAAADNIKKWRYPKGEFMQNLKGHNAILNSLSLNEDNVLFSGGDNGTMRFWDWNTGYCFQSLETKVQPGSLESEAGIFASTFDLSGSRLITCEADKSIKVWAEDEDASPESHPIDPTWRPSKELQGRF